MKHRFLLYNIAIIASIITGSLGAIDRNPTTIEPGLLVPNSAIALTQEDFKSGTYRITEPGYYYFAENVSFEPCAKFETLRTDKPVHGGWFTALSIECDNVIVDLNTKTFDCTQRFVDTHLFKVFSMIELNNSPFPHFIFAFNGETKIKNAHNVVIRNGVLARNPHHGVHGNSNSNVQLYDLTIKDWEVAGISFNGLKNGMFKNIQISGLEHKVPFTGLMTVLNSALKVLEQLRDGGDGNTQEHIDALNGVIANPATNGMDDAIAMHDGNAYGILLNHLVDVGPQPTLHDSVTTDAVEIENVTVCNMKSQIIETVGIKDNSGNLLKGPVFGVLRWVDAYPSGTFAPNGTLKAQVYATNAIAPSNYPAGFAANILSATPNEGIFLSQVQPNFNHDFAGHTNKGVFGIRVDVAHGVSLKNCTICSIENSALLGKTLDTIAAGSNYTVQPGRSHAGDVFGISFAGCHSCSIENTQAYNCGSASGNVYGISLAGQSNANNIANTLSNSHYALHDGPATQTNPASTVYGYLVEGDCDGNIFEHCRSCDLFAPRFVHGFSVHGPSSRGNIFNHCFATHNVANSSVLTSAKEATGFAARNSDCTVFNECEGSNMQCTNEGGESSSRAYGFFVDEDDNNSTISKCIARGNIGGGGKGYGYRGEENSLLLMSNLGYTNQTANFNIAGGTLLPVVSSTDLSLLASGTNVSID